MSRRIFALALFVCLLLISPVRGQSEPDFKILVDSRIELLSVVEVLADYEWAGLITEHESAYAKELREHFEPFRNHRAVGLFSKMCKTGFAFDAPVAAVFHLTNPPELKPIVKMDPSIARRAGGAEQINEFFDALRDFAIESDFQTFFDNHRGFYKSVEKIGYAEAKAEGVDMGDLERYHGIKQHSYRLVLAPMLHSGGFGPRVLREDGTFDVYMVTGPRRLEGDQPVFPKGKDLNFLTMHEFGHSFINPLVEEHSDDFARFGALFDPISEQMSKMAYSEWETSVIEHIVRAADCRMHLAKHGDEAYQRVINNDIERGFIYIDELCEALVQYETSRDEYPTFADFFPEMIAVFERAMADAGVTARAAAPTVIKSWPPAGATDVDPNMTEIKVEYDQDMEPSSYAWIRSNEGAYPEETGTPGWVSSRTAMLPVALEPDTTYWLGLNYAQFKAFASVEGVHADEFILTFTTRSKGKKAAAKKPKKTDNPNVVKTWPSNGATDVDPRTTQIRVQFDQEMHPRAYAWTQSYEPYPDVTGDPTWTDAYTNVLPVKLMPNTTYWIGLNYEPNISFQNMHGKMAEEFILTFTTGSGN